ncbi:MAG: lipid II flippase MurJ [Armatimonadota bacterium]|nr:lipid II flippase MurJ [Armatimonadota bacterium]
MRDDEQVVPLPTDPAAAPPFTRQTWIAASIILIVTTLLSKGMGFLRDILIAWYFGTSGQVDAFMVAVAVPTLVGGLGFALSMAVIPAFRRALATEGLDTARELSSAAVALTVAVSMVLMLAIATGAPYLIRIFAPGLPAPDAALAAGLMRWLSLLVLCVNLFYVLGAIYNAMEHFTIPAVTDLASNVIVLAFLFLLAGRLGIAALAGGMVTGALVVVAALTVPLAARRMLAVSGRLWSPAIRRMVWLAGPVFAIEVLSQGTTLIENYFGAEAGTGVIASLGYAKRLSVMVVALVGTNIARAVFPVMSRLASEHSIDSARDLFSKLSRQYAIAFIPVSVLLAYFHDDVVRLVFARGAFDAAAAERTGAAFLYYSAGLALGAVVPMLIRTCYAFSDARAPLTGTVMQLVMMGVLNTLLAPRLGIVGIALSSTLALLPPVLVMGRALAGHLGGLAVGPLLRTVAFSALAAGVALVPLVAVSRGLDVPAGLAAVALQTMLYLGVYVGGAFVVLPREMRSLVATLRRGE